MVWKEDADRNTLWFESGKIAWIVVYPVYHLLLSVLDVVPSVNGVGMLCG